MKRVTEKVTERSIRFPDTLYIQGMALAQREGISFPELIRGLLAKELGDFTVDSKPPRAV